jgi:hypothetical protein
MLTEKKIENAIIKFFNVEKTILALGSIKRHSNICWEYVKNDEDIALCGEVYLRMTKLMNEGKIQEKSLPFRKSIMGYSFKRLIICKNRDAGVNLLKRYGVNEIGIDMESVKIDGEVYYLIY